MSPFLPLKGTNLPLFRTKPIEADKRRCIYKCFWCGQAHICFSYTVSPWALLVLYTQQWPRHQLDSFAGRRVSNRATLRFSPSRINDLRSLVLVSPPAASSRHVNQQSCGLVKYNSPSFAAAQRTRALMKVLLHQEGRRPLLRR